jgi:hypothetical protein
VTCSNDQSCIFLGYDNQMNICGSEYYTIEMTGIGKVNSQLRMLIVEKILMILISINTEMIVVALSIVLFNLIQYGLLNISCAS